MSDEAARQDHDDTLRTAFRASGNKGPCYNCKRYMDLTKGQLCRECDEARPCKRCGTVCRGIDPAVGECWQCVSRGWPKNA